MVVLALMLLVGMVGIIVVKGLSHFWPEDLHQIVTVDDEKFLGEIAEQQRVRPPATSPGESVKGAIDLPFPRVLSESSIAGHGARIRKFLLIRGWRSVCVRPDWGGILCSQG